MPISTFTPIKNNVPVQNNSTVTTPQTQTTQPVEPKGLSTSAKVGIGAAAVGAMIADIMKIMKVYREILAVRQKPVLPVNSAWKVRKQISAGSALIRMGVR